MADDAPADHVLAPLPGDPPPKVGFSTLQAWLISTGVVLVGLAVAAAALILAFGVADNDADIDRTDDEVVTLGQVVALLRSEDASDDERACRGAHAAVGALRDLVEFDDGVISETDRAAVQIFRDRLVTAQCD